MELIDNIVGAGPATSNGFFQAYYLSLLRDTFYVLTDPDHRSGFKMQSLVLARLFRLVENGDIQAPLFDTNSVQDANMTNARYVAEYSATLLKNAFPHLSK